MFAPSPNPSPDNRVRGIFVKQVRAGVNRRSHLFLRNRIPPSLLGKVGREAGDGELFPIESIN